MRKATVLLFIATILTAAVPQMGSAEVLTLKDYLAQVEQNNPELKSSLASQKGLELKPKELDMQYSPLFKAGTTYLESHQESISPLSPERTDVLNWNLALSKKWFTGTTLSLDYDMTFTKLYTVPVSGPGIPSWVTALFSTPSDPYYDAKPSLSISQSLLRDFMGGLTDAGIDKVKRGADAGKIMERYRSAGVLFQAEQNYWNLSMARAVVEYKELSLSRTAKMKDWTEPRVALNLADQADLLQMQAAVKLRELDLKMAMEDLKNAQSRFNLSRGIDNDSVTEKLEEISIRLASASSEPIVRAKPRLDVQASAMGLEVARQLLVKPFIAHFQS